MRFAIFSQATGQILRLVSCAIESAEEQLRTGEAVIPMADGDDTTHYIADGDLVPMPAQPAPHFAFDWGAKAWYDPRTLQQLREEKWAEIKTAKTTAEQGGFCLGSYKFDSDEKAQISLQRAALTAQLNANFSTRWTLADNTTAELDAQALLAVAVALGEHMSRQHEHAAELRGRIEVTNTAAELQQIVW